MERSIRLPRARTAQLVTTGAGAEVLVYDQLTHHIHHLNASCATVWRLCDGQRSVTEIARGAGMTEAVVRVALAKLADAGLLAGPVAVDDGPSSKSRRAVLKRAALAGAVPVIVSVTAPMAAQAQTGSADSPARQMRSVLISSARSVWML